MANSPLLQVRVRADLKDAAEEILEELGITPGQAIIMFYRQIVLTRSLPLSLCLLDLEPVFEKSPKN